MLLINPERLEMGPTNLQWVQSYLSAKCVGFESFYKVGPVNIFYVNLLIINDKSVISNTEKKNGISASLIQIIEINVYIIFIVTNSIDVNLNEKR